MLEDSAPAPHTIFFAFVHKKYNSECTSQKLTHKDDVHVMKKSGRKQMILGEIIIFAMCCDLSHLFSVDCASVRNFNVFIASHFRAHAPLPHGYCCMGTTLCATYARMHKPKNHAMEIDTRVHQSIDHSWCSFCQSNVPYGWNCKFSAFVLFRSGAVGDNGNEWWW